MFRKFGVVHHPNDSHLYPPHLPQALLYIPEAAVKLPPIHVLVVDYSSIYGTDCAAVDTIVMQVGVDIWVWTDSILAHSNIVPTPDLPPLPSSLLSLTWAPSSVGRTTSSSLDG